MRKALCLLTALLLFLLAGTCGTAAGEEVILLPEEVINSPWYRDQKAKVIVGNPTPLSGCFFTGMWGGTTSDLDVQDLLHAYSPILWDGVLGRFRFDHSVATDALITDDENGNRIYLIALDDDLYWSDGEPVTARDYAFSMLLQMDPAVAEAGGTPVDYSWLAGSDEYVRGEANTVSGLRVLTDYLLQITMKAESLPYFYELQRLNVRPYPISEIAPGSAVADDGYGAYLTQPLTAEILRENVLDDTIGYLRHPRKVSGPFVLESFDGRTAWFAVNPQYKGNEDGVIPHIGEIEYTLADNADMIQKLADGYYDLLNKVTYADAIEAGIELLRSSPESYSIDNEMRSGLTMIWFLEDSALVQDYSVRQAIARCFDREAFIRQYTGSYGLITDGYYGMGQWTYRTAAGLSEPPVIEPENGASAQEHADYEAALREWETVTLDGLTLYETDTAEAVRILEADGWTLNEAGEPFDSTRDQVRCKQTGDGLISLKLTLAMPVSAEARAAIDECLTANLREAGISLRVKEASMAELQDAYEGRLENEADMIYLGDNLPLAFNPEIFARRTENTQLGAVREEIHSLAEDLVRTEPEDLLGYARKWVRMQEKITETLPLLPVYSNIYFDFFTRRLHNYRITKAVTWGAAIVPAYMSDMEEITEEEKEREEELLREITFIKNNLKPVERMSK